MHRALADDTLDRLIEGVLSAKSAAIAEVLACVEDTRPAMLDRQRRLIGRLERETPGSHTVVGLTGPPGVGKSSLAAAMIHCWLRQDSGVGMVAVDPSSRRSGGALLGDRARLRFDPDDRVFVRSMAARDQLGGLAPAARAAVVVLRAAFSWTLVETVGVGQSEIDIETLADSVVLVLQPGSGDTLQFMKAGILEIPDALVVHKWDLGAVAVRTRADLESILGRGSPTSGKWTPRILGASALAEEGIDELLATLNDHRAHLDDSGELIERRRKARTAWALELFVRRYGTRGLDRLGGRSPAETLARNAEGTALDAFSALATHAGLAE